MNSFSSAGALFIAASETCPSAHRSQRNYADQENLNPLNRLSASPVFRLTLLPCL